ncbi:hypothetical protein ACFP1Z_05135 [Streptomyces gamaensis]|uniref:Uncharacterized protein n=1 Tax=Streptomyces gamaensis TaxID=1763542 RepID=A0ABW0YTR5_9ACTN
MRPYVLAYEQQAPSPEPYGHVHGPHNPVEVPRHHAPYEPAPEPRPGLTPDQRNRRTALALALDGIDIGPSVIHGHRIGTPAVPAPRTAVAV